MGGHTCLDLDLNPPEGNSNLMEASGIWLDPVSRLLPLLFSPKAPFCFCFTLVLPALCLRPGEVFASGKPTAASVFEQLLCRARYLVYVC